MGHNCEHAIEKHKIIRLILHHKPEKYFLINLIPNVHLNKNIYIYLRATKRIIIH